MPDLRAGRAFIEFSLRDQLFRRQLDRISSRLNRFGLDVAKIGARITALGGLGTGLATALSSPFLVATNAAGSFEETLSKLNNVFGDSTREIQEFAQGLSNTVRRSNVQLTEFLANAGSQLFSIGFDEKSVVEYSKLITQLSIDLASFNDIEDLQSFQAITAALNGERERLKNAFNVSINQNQVNEELAKLGIDPQDAIQTEKALATLNLLIAKTSKAQNDAVETQDSYTNSVKGAAGAVRDLAVTIGQQLLGSITPYVQQFEKLVTSTDEFIRNNRGLVLDFAKVSAALIAGGAAITAFGVAITAVSVPILAFSSVVGALSATVGFLASPLGLVAAAVAAFGSTVVHEFGGIPAVLDRAGEAFTRLRSRLGSSINSVIDKLKEGKIEEASKELWSGLRQRWDEGVASLGTTWAEWKTDFIAQIRDGMKQAIDIAGDGFIKMSTIWTESITIMKAAWNNLLTDFLTGAVTIATLGVLIREALIGLGDRDQLRETIRGVARDFEVEIRAIQAERDQLNQNLFDASDQQIRKLRERITELRDSVLAIIEPESPGLTSNRFQPIREQPTIPSPEVDKELKKVIGGIARGQFGGQNANQALGSPSELTRKLDDMKKVEEEQVEELKKVRALFNQLNPVVFSS